ncbi:MAG: DeoR family transcriptional regulator [Candidatus Methanomethylophilaceae archaeon]
MTYFIRYNLKMILEAMDVFDTYLERKTEERNAATKDLERQGLNHRQLQILTDMMHDEGPVSQYELSVKYRTTVSTIRRDLMRLMEMGLIRKFGKDGHRLLYIYDPKDSGSS